jgi:hypothetical protein
MEPVLLDWNQLVIDPLMLMVKGAVAFIPNIISSMLVILVGLFLAIVARELVSAFLKSVGFDGFAKRINLFSANSEEDAGKPAPHQYAAKWAYWIVLLSVIVSVFERLRLQAVSTHIESLVDFAVTVFVASMIAVIGLFLSMLAHRVVRATARDVGYVKPESLANAAKWAVVFSTAIICLFQIGIPREIILIILGATYVTLCITFIVAFGLGGRSFAAAVLNKLIEPRK